jgi:hypothetical protein
MVLVIAWSIFAAIGYLLWRYTCIVRRVKEAFDAYDGSCCHEHSRYDVEESYRRLHCFQMVYVALACVLLYVCL